MDIIVDPEFESLIPPLSEHESRQLECSLLYDGALEPLVIWTPHNILLDGHHRLRLCRQHSIPFKTASLEFGSRDAARLWIVGHQLGRRNLAPEQVAYYRGREYAEQRRDPGENLQKSQCFPKAHSDTSEASQEPDSTAQHLAKKHDVSPATIKRDACFARSLDILAKILGEEFRSEVLAGNGSLSKKDIITLAEVPRKHIKAADGDPAKLRALAKAWREREQEPSPEENELQVLAEKALAYQNGLRNIIWVCEEGDDTLDGRGERLMQVAAMAREALDEEAVGEASEEALITDEDLL